MGWDRVTAGVHYSFTVRVARPVTDLVILQSSISHLTPTNLIISPPALLLVLYGVHVVQQHGAVLVGPDEDNVKVDMLLVASKAIMTAIVVKQMADNQPSWLAWSPHRLGTGHGSVWSRAGWSTQSWGVSSRTGGGRRGDPPGGRAGRRGRRGRRRIRLI